MASKLFNRLNLVALGLVILIISFLGIMFYVRYVTLDNLRSTFSSNNKTIASLKQEQKSQSGLLDKITFYRDALHGLNLVLEARKNVMSGSDIQNPYLVFDFSQVLNDLRQLIPQDARATKFQVNNKGLMTLPIESVDCASLGRVLKSFKDRSQLQSSEKNKKTFTEVKIPSGVQRSIVAQLAVKLGLTEEVDTEHFYPEQEISRLEALTALLTLFKVDLKSLEHQESFSTLPFVDILEDDANLPIFLAAHQKGLFDHMTGEFQSELPITRAEVAYWVWKLKLD